MASARSKWHRRLPYTVGVFACLTLAMPAKAAEGDAQGGRPSPPAAVAGPQASGAIPSLIAKLEKQIAENHEWTPPNDNAAETFAAISALIPGAPPSDVELVLDMFARFAERAREAEVAGRHDEAKRFAVWGGPGNAQQTPQQPDPPRRSDSIATAPGRPPEGPPATRSEAPAVLAEREGANHRETAPANAADGDAQSGQPPPHGAAEDQTPGTIALLAKLETQIAENHMATPPNDNAADTLQAILTLLPNAPLADSQLVAAAFSHFADRARRAEDAGRHDEARRFATFGDLRGGMTLNDGAAQPAAVPSGKAPAAAPSPAKPQLTAQPAAKPAPAEPDARATVLARLRGQAPARGGAAHVASDKPATIVAPAEPLVAMQRQRLLDARTALEAGRVDDAGKLLRQAQVQLVLRPAAPSREASAAGSVAAGQIAEALSELSAGDVRDAIRYINLAAAQADHNPAVSATAAQPFPPR